MTTKDIFTLVVRLSGFFTSLMAVHTMLALILGPRDIGFRSFLVTLAYVGLGYAIMRFASVITRLCGAEE
ncbi:MAG: hypothetical protein JKY61_05240 [Planctomycetes bacterium]|nr:hypothetical protein [Planctomycetota bacterium]